MKLTVTAENVLHLDSRHRLILYTSTIDIFINRREKLTLNTLKRGHCNEIAHLVVSYFGMNVASR